MRKTTPTLAPEAAVCCIARLLLLFALLGPVPLLAAGNRPETAEEWLHKLGPAMNMTSYRGVFVYARGDQVSSMKIAHRYRHGEVEERLVRQDGESGEIIRKGTRVFCILPERGHIQLNQVIPSGPFAEAFNRQLIPVSEWYAPVRLEDDRVAGHETVQIALNARDVNRYSYRLWLEKKTGLLVKSEVRSTTDKVLEKFQFTSLELTHDLSDQEFEIQSKTPVSGARSSFVTLPDSPLPAADGWKLGWTPDGFEPAATPQAGKHQAVAFSDGLAGFSVFVESLGSIKMPTGASRIGATTVYMRQLAKADRDFLITVVGEVPPATAMKVADSVIIDHELGRAH